MENVNILDYGYDIPSLETDEGTITGSPEYFMVVTIGEDVNKRIPLTGPAYADLHGFLTGEN